jgi:phospholipid-binding lipoprotein MlaA
MKNILGAAVLVSLAASSLRAAEPAKKPDEKMISIGASTESEFEEFDAEFGKQKQESLRVSDPLRGFNRAMFWFNDKFYFYFAKPIAKGYGFIIPEPARVSINRAFTNSTFAVRFVNAGLQLRFKGAGHELERFLVNTTLGIGGLFDPADKWFHIKACEADFGQTFGRWGIGHGPPLVLPILGQTNVRDGIGLVPNFLGDPPYWFLPYWSYVGYTAGVKMNYVSLHIGDYEKVKKDSLDPYTFIRDAHLQYREKKVQEAKENKD